MKSNKEKKIKEVLIKNVEQILPDRDKLANLMKKRKIRLYLGIDPTSPKIHLGNAVCLRKLREFQVLGHEIIFLIGNFTAQIGDPSGRDKRRKSLTSAQIQENMSAYQKQASKIIDISKIQIKHNAEWLGNLSFNQLIKMASYFTTSQILERDMFKERLGKRGEVWMNELLYPLMQGYDSVAMDVDLEIGGTDQTFNMLVGRKLQKIYNKKEKYVLTIPLLPGLDGRKMSKSYGNVVNITDKPDDMYGKIMSLKDELIFVYFELCTDLNFVEIEKKKDVLKKKKANPRELKAELAREIVKIYHGKNTAEKAEKEFNRVFKEKNIPSEIKTVKIEEKKINILDFLMKTHQIKSKSEGKRLILQKAVKINGSVKNDWREVIKPQKGSIIRVGKRSFVKIV